MVEELGQGATGKVFKANDPHLNRLVAIKVLKISGTSEVPTERAAEMFSCEARTIARLVHPGIVQIYDVFDDASSGTQCMVMEFVPGGTLGQQIPSGVPIPLDRALLLARHMGEALDYAHSKCFLHLDLKPANILITEDGRCKIADFGLARFWGRVGAIVTNSIHGTPAYISPERISAGIVDERSDVFALGVILYQMLTGRQPFTGNVVSVLHSIVYDQPVPASQLNPTLTAQYDAMLARCLAKDPAQRIAGAGAFLEEIEMLAHPTACETLSGRPSVLVPVAVPSCDHETPAQPKDEKRRQLSKSAVRFAGSLSRVGRRLAGWPIGGLTFTSGPAAKSAGLVLLSIALSGKLWLDFVPGAKGLSSPSRQTAVLTLSNPGAHAPRVVSAMAWALDAPFLSDKPGREPIMSGEADLQNVAGLEEKSNRVDLGFTGGAELNPKSHSSAQRRGTRRTARASRRFASGRSVQVPNGFALVGFDSEGLHFTGVSTPSAAREVSADLPSWAAGLYSAPQNPLALDALASGSFGAGLASGVPAKPTQKMERVRFVCEYDLGKGTLTLSLDGKTAFQEKLDGRKESFLGFHRSYTGLISRVIMIPASTRTISVEVVSANRSLRLENMISPDTGMQTLRATIRSGDLQLEWVRPRS